MKEAVCHLVQHNVQWQEFIALMPESLAYELKYVTLIVGLESQAMFILCFLFWP